MGSRLYRVAFLVCAGLLTLAIVAGCGGSAPTTIAVTLKDFTIDLVPATAKAGQVTFNVKNASSGTEHELVVLQTDLPADQLPTKSDGTADEAKVTSMGETGDLAANASSTLTFTLPAGHYALICNVPTHYAQHMYKDFTVTP